MRFANSIAMDRKHVFFLRLLLGQKTTSGVRPKTYGFFNGLRPFGPMHDSKLGFFLVFFTSVSVRRLLGPASHQNDGTGGNLTRGDGGTVLIFCAATGD